MNNKQLFMWLAVGALCCVGQLGQALESDKAATASTTSTEVSRKDVNEEMQLINKSLEGLLSELAAIKREATGRLSQMKSKLAASAAATSPNDQERIRQTKVSRFVLKRVAELELESLGMRDEMVKLFELQKKTLDGEQRLMGRAAGVKQEDFDFDQDQPANGVPAPTTTTTTTTLKPTSEQEAAQIGFDLEQLKRLGEEIGKRLDQFGKDAAKNLGELVEGIKLVFREPKGKPTSTTPLPAGLNK